MKAIYFLLIPILLNIDEGTASKDSYILMERPYYGETDKSMVGQCNTSLYKPVPSVVFYTGTFSTLDFKVDYGVTYKVTKGELIKIIDTIIKSNLVEKVDTSDNFKGKISRYITNGVPATVKMFDAIFPQIQQKLRPKVAGAFKNIASRV